MHALVQKIGGALAGEFARAPTLGSEAVELAALIPMIGGEHPATMAGPASYRF